MLKEQKHTLLHFVNSGCTRLIRRNFMFC